MRPGGDDTYERDFITTGDAKIEEIQKIGSSIHTFRLRGLSCSSWWKIIPPSNPALTIAAKSMKIDRGPVVHFLRVPSTP